MEVSSDSEIESGKESEGKKSEAEEEDATLLDDLNWKNKHPERLHEEMWFNLPGEVREHVLGIHRTGKYHPLVTLFLLYCIYTATSL